MPTHLYTAQELVTRTPLVQLFNQHSNLSLASLKVE